MDYRDIFGAAFRRVLNREHQGKPARVVVVSGDFVTNQNDLWRALTDIERIPRWFAPISGELKLGGRYQIEGNAGGVIEHCDAPNAFEASWEYAEQISWISLRLAPSDIGTKLTLEHIMPKDDVSEAHWRQYGPGATGVGWDLSFFGLARHLEDVSAITDQEADMTWLASEDGKAFMRGSAAAWGAAHVASGEAPETANAMAARTAEFYTGS